MERKSSCSHIKIVLLYFKITLFMTTTSSIGKMLWVRIPYFVGVRGYPTYPVMEGYARHVLIVYKPWRQYPNKASWSHEFNVFVNSSQCPKSATLTYNRVMRHYYDSTQFLEPTVPASKCDRRQCYGPTVSRLRSG
jgi:hypothetical protein